MKKIFVCLLLASLTLSLVGCTNNNNVNIETPETPDVPETPDTPDTPDVPETPDTPSDEGTIKLENLDSNTKELLSDKGYSGLDDSLKDFSQYENTIAYRKVKNVSELLSALKDARYEYTTTVDNIFGTGYVVRNNVRKNETNWKNAITKGLYLLVDGEYVKIPADTPWDANDTYYTASKTYYEDSPLLDASYTQTLKSSGSVRVIEITSDIDLGYNKLSQEDISTGIVNNFVDSRKLNSYTMSDMVTTSGISQIAIERTNDLLIFSKNGAKLTHGGFKINYSKNIVIRNLEMDEIWQWEDIGEGMNTSKIGDYDAFGWAYFKIGYSENIWIDHCEFGKSFDGQIDVSNPYYNSVGTINCAPYQGTGKSSVHISWCNFKGGSDDKDGYLYKMMTQIEENYQNVKNNGAVAKYKYYNALRDLGATFEDILYGVAIPQKKGFLLNDSGNEYKYNKNLRVSFANCKFTNIEDRIPKLRTGVCYMYNSIIDSSQYFTYRDKLEGLNAKSIMESKGFKCALTSQCLLSGNGGSVAMKNCIIDSVKYFIKNNDTELTNKASDAEATLAGGYILDNISYKASPTSTPITNSNQISVSGNISTSLFKWRTSDGLAPFEVNTIDLASLSDIINNSDYGCGVRSSFGNLWLKISY